MTEPIVENNKFIYTLSGKVLPERAVVNLPQQVLMVASNEGTMPLGWQLTISIINSQIAARLSSTQEVTDVEDMRERVEGAIRFCVDSLGYILACGYDVELTQVTLIQPEPMQHIVFGVDVQGIRPKQQYTHQEVLDLFQKTVAVPRHKQQPLRRALVDFREAIRSYEDTPFFCFRAIEDIRQLFVTDQDNDVKRTWEKMSASLNVPIESIEYVWKKLRPIATQLRHGGSVDATSRADRLEMLKITWSIIDLFILASIPASD